MHISLKSFHPAWWFPFFSFLIMLPLFYIDEGKYSFEGWYRLDNIAGMTMYIVLWSTIQAAIYFVLYRMKNEVFRAISASSVLLFLLIVLGIYLSS